MLFTKMLTIPFVFLSKIITLVVVPTLVADTMLGAKFSSVQAICAATAVAIWIAMVNTIINKHYVAWLDKE